LSSVVKSAELGASFSPLSYAQKVADRVGAEHPLSGKYFPGNFNSFSKILRVSEANLAGNFDSLANFRFTEGKLIMALRHSRAIRALRGKVFRQFWRIEGPKLYLDRAYIHQ
jgi:hypothetical protein